MKQVFARIVVAMGLLGAAEPLLASDTSDGGTVGTGGDAIAATFVAYAWQLQEMMKGDLQALFPEIDAVKLEEAINQTDVESHNMLVVGGVEKDAVAFPDRRKIKVSRHRWPSILLYSVNSRFQLVLHEYLHVLKIADLKYEISRRLQSVPASRLEGGFFSTLNDTPPQAEYLELFDAFGQPLFSFSERLGKRFGAAMNREVPAREMSARDRRKSRQILRELARAVDRTRMTEKSFLLIDNEEACRASSRYEETGEIAPRGAWSVAICTASRHHFREVPMAEFLSELLRQAYRRAGYAVTEDFNEQRNNRLIWTHSASVEGLTNYLIRAGWIPWDSSLFRVPVGALVFHHTGLTPGHGYAAAGLDGRFIVDGFHAEGKDLSTFKGKTIRMMFMGGVFFLPPGIIPGKW